MQALWTYPVALRREEGEFHASCSALPEAIASGRTKAQALEEMREALAAAVRGRLKDGMDLPPPDETAATRRERHRVALPAQLAAKATVFFAWKRANISKVELALRMERDEKDVRRILDPDHGTRLDQLDDAMRALGGSLVIGFATDRAA